ncbi:MAG: hypothetical protein WCL39_13945, partial [Armatimonadota bacterium]
MVIFSRQKADNSNSSDAAQPVAGKARFWNNPSFLCASVSGLCFGLSQVFTEFGLLALASYVLLGVALSEPDRRPPITRVLISGIVGYAIALIWILGFGGVPWVLLVLLHMLFVVPTGLAAGFVLRERPNALAVSAVLG